MCSNCKQNKPDVVYGYLGSIEMYLCDDCDKILDDQDRTGLIFDMLSESVTEFTYGDSGLPPGIVI